MVVALRDWGVDRRQCPGRHLYYEATQKAFMVPPSPIPHVNMRRAIPSNVAGREGAPTPPPRDNPLSEQQWVLFPQVLGLYRCSRRGGGGKVT